MSVSMPDSSTKHGKSQHWFRKYAETIPVQHLPSAVVGAVRGTMYSHGSTRDKMHQIRKLIEIHDDLIGKKGA